MHYVIDGNTGLIEGYTYDPDGTLGTVPFTFDGDPTRYTIKVISAHAFEKQMQRFKHGKWSAVNGSTELFQDASAIAAANSGGGGDGVFGRALGGFLMGAMMGGGGSNSMDMAIAGAQAAAQGGNALEVINSVGAASGVSGGSAIAGAAGMSGGGAFAAQPSALGGSGACGGMNESNYRQMGLSGGGDVQLKTMCAQSYELYNNYKNAVAQGYSEADIQRAYAAHQQSAMVVQQFYNETHDGSGGGIQQDTHGPQAPPPIVSGPSSSAPATPCHAPEGTSCVSPQ